MRYRIAIISLLLMNLSTVAAAETFDTNDTAMTIEEMKAKFVGNSWSGDYEGVTFAEYIDPNGEIRGKSEKDGTYTAHWRFRDDGLFCFDYGDPSANGCVQLILKGNEIGARRLDGVVEGSYKLSPGNEFKL